MFFVVALAFVMVRKASIVFSVSSTSVVPFNQIEKWSSCVNYRGIVSLFFCLIF